MTKATIAGMIIVLAAGVMYATTCTVTCALEVCIRPEAEHAASHHNHESSGSPSAPSEQGSHESDCSTHGHPGSFLKAPAGPQTTISVVRQAQISSAVVVASPDFPQVRLPFGRAHAPPPGSKEPLYSKISVLRI